MATRFEYKIFDCSRTVLSEQIDKYAADGWRVITTVPYAYITAFGVPTATHWTVVLERSKAVDNG